MRTLIGILLAVGLIPALIRSSSPPVPAPYKCTATGCKERAPNAKMGDVVSVKDFGATGDGSTDDTAAIQAAITAVGSGTTYLPCGNYKLNSGLTVSGTGAVIRGAGYCSQIRINHTSDAIAASGSLFRLQDVEVVVVTTTTRSGSAIIHATAGQGSVSNVRLTGNGTSVNNGYGFLLDNDNADNWQFSHVRVPGGATWDSVWRLTLVAGTVASTFLDECHVVNGVVLNAIIDIDGAIDTFLVTNSDFPSYGGYAVRLQNTVGAGSGFPRYVHFSNTSVEGGNGGGAPTTAINAVKVIDFEFTGGYVASATTGIVFGAGVQYAKVIGAHFVSMQQSAVTIDASAVHVTLADNSFVDSGQQTDNTYDDISIAAGNLYTKLIGNSFAVTGGTKPRYHVNLLAGGTDRYLLLGNTQTLSSTSTAFINNGATGSNRTIAGNSGFTNTFSGDQTTFNTQVNVNTGAKIEARGGIENDSGDLALTASTNIVSGPAFKVTSTTAGGTITLSTGTGTATVFTGARCVCTDSTANASVRCAVASTTLTATGTGSDVIAYHCF